MHNYKMIIDGVAVGTVDNFGVLNPATGEVFATVPAGQASHVDAAVAAARRAFPLWAARSDSERQAACLALAEVLKANMPELMKLVTMETGKPLGGLNGVGSGMEVGGAMVWAQVTAGLSLPVDVIQDDDDARIEVYRKPIGVVGRIPQPLLDQRFRLQQQPVAPKRVRRA